MSMERGASAAAPPLVWLGRLSLVVGTALILVAAICFFAWNWRSLSDSAKFLLAVGGFLACAAGSLAAERYGRSVPADLALLAACLFMGMFWVVFGQTFQSGATAQDFCLVWAACVTPFLLLRRTASLWNLWAILLLAAIADKSLATVSPLPPLALAAALCGMALIPPRVVRRKPGLNAWLALPLTALLALGTGYTLLLIIEGQLADRYPSLMAGPAVLAAALIPAVRSRNALAMGEFGLVGLVLLNACLFRLMLTSPTATGATIVGFFTVGNIVYTLLLVSVMPGLLGKNAAVPPPADSLPAEREPNPGRPRRRLFPIFLAGLGGVISACFLVSFTSLLFGKTFGLASAQGFIVLSILYMIAGALLWRSRRRGVFVLTLAPILAAAGAVFYESQLSAFFNHSQVFTLAAKWLAGVALYLTMDCAPLRFGLTLWIIMATFRFFNILPEPFSLAAMQALGLACLLPLVWAAWGRPALPERPHKTLARLLRPAAFAAIWAAFSLLPLFHDVVGMSRDPNAVQLPAGLITAFCAANLVLLAWRSPLLRATWRQSGVALPVAGILVLGLLCLFAPAETLLALNLVLVGKFAARPAERKWSSLPLFITGLILLAASLCAFYYQLEVPFPDKIPRMGIPGICLLAGGLLLERYCGQSRTAWPLRLPVRDFLRRAAPLALTALLMPALFFAAVADRRAILRDGSDCLLSLAPRDPRAFMLGDYMGLSYELESYPGGWKAGPGCLPLKPDEHGVVPGVAWPDETLFMPEASCDKAPVPALTIEQHGERVVPRLPRRYYFEEGLAGLYEDARYAVLRCDKRNRCLLTGLADRSGRIIEPDAASARAE